MLFILLIIALTLALLLSYKEPRKPTRCRCGRPADVFDHDRPWIVYCGKCYLKKEGIL